MESAHLLIVEDHPATGTALRKFLETSGYRVDVARTMQDGLAAARTREYAVLICDLNLPDGTGWDLVAELRDERPVRAIAFSAYDEPEHVKRSEEAGFIDHITKGADADLLLMSIARALATQAAA